MDAVDQMTDPHTSTEAVSMDVLPPLPAARALASAPESLSSAGAAAHVGTTDPITIRVKMPTGHIVKLPMDVTDKDASDITEPAIELCNKKHATKLSFRDDPNYDWSRASLIYMSRFIKQGDAAEAPEMALLQALFSQGKLIEDKPVTIERKNEEGETVEEITVCLLDKSELLSSYTSGEQPVTVQLTPKAKHGVLIYAPRKAVAGQAFDPNAPLTDALLDHVQWHDPQPPNFLHALTPFGLTSSVTGDKLAYVPPPSFDEAYTSLTAAARTIPLGREYKKVFLDGPSGSGKTRVVWELYRRLQAEVMAGSSPWEVQAVSYVYVNLTNSFLPPDVMNDDTAVMKRLAKHIISQLGLIEAHSASNITLDGVLTSLFRGKRGALVLHIDEFHRLPEETVRLLSVVRMYSVRKNTPAIILAACSGLYTHPSFDPFKVSSVVKRIALGYFRDHQKTWQIVRGAASAVAAAGRAVHPLLVEEDLTKAPQNMQYLVEDIAGWPMAAVQLGVNTQARAELRQSASVQELAGVEDLVVKALEEVYPAESRRDTFGNASNQALFKIATLALAPFPVTNTEPINGITVADIRQYGLIDDQPVRARDVTEYAAGPAKVSARVLGEDKFFLRMSKPLLRMIVNELHVLEIILTGCATTLPEGALPDGLVLSDLLRTCRRYDADTQEAVQLISHLVAIHAWLVIEDDRPDADHPSLLTLRPGAKVLGNVATATETLTYLTAAATAVDAAGKDKVGSKRTESRLEAALEHGIRLVKRTNTPAAGTAALSKAGEAGYDMVVQVGGVTQHGQTKGREVGPAAGARGGDAGVIPSDIRDILKGLKTAISGQDGETPAAAKGKAEAGKGKGAAAKSKAGAAKGEAAAAKGEAAAAQSKAGAAKGKAAAAVDDDGPVMRLELLFAGKASPTIAQILSGSREGKIAAESLHEISQVLGDKSCAIVMMRSELDRALGPVFGGIAARCDKGSAKEVAGTAVAAGTAVGAAVTMDEEEDESPPSSLPGADVGQGKRERIVPKRAGSGVIDADKNAPPKQAPKKGSKK